MAGVSQQHRGCDCDGRREGAKPDVGGMAKWNMASWPITRAGHTISAPARTDAAVAGRQGCKKTKAVEHNENVTADAATATTE